MRFSLFFELQLSGPSPASEAALLRAAVAQAVLADKLGYACVWAVEHHGLYEYSHCSAPEVFLSFVAARTERIRIGHGVTLLPFRYNHPIRVAERIATLDVLSEGRVCWGTGKSASRVEQRAFQCAPEDLDAEWEEALRIIPRMWAQPVFEHEGRFLRIPPTSIVPKPLQQPHPPIYAACTRDASIQRAGRLGLGALCFALGSEQELAGRVRAYRDAAADAEPVGARSLEHFAIAPPSLVLASDREACRHGFRAARFFSEQLHRYYFADELPAPASTQPAPGFHSESAVASARHRRGTTDDTYNVLIGDPGFAHEYIARCRELGIDELILVMQMGTLPNELVLESVRTFGEQVLPHYA